MKFSGQIPGSPKQYGCRESSVENLRCFIQVLKHWIKYLSTIQERERHVPISWRDFYINTSAVYNFVLVSQTTAPGQLLQVFGNGCIYQQLCHLYTVNEAMITLFHIVGPCHVWQNGLVI